MRPSGVGSALRKLVGASAVYGLGSVLVRGLAFLLLPLYTRYLSPAEYGIVALTVTCTVVLGLLYPLGLRGAVSRTYYEGGTVEERRERVGTLWIAMILSAAAMALLLDRAGPSLAAALLPEVPFHPYLRLAVWTAFLGVLGLTPLVLLQAQERPLAFVLLTLWTALATTAATVWLVVKGGGAAGYLQGALVGAGLAAIPYLAADDGADPAGIPDARSLAGPGVRPSAGAARAGRLGAGNVGSRDPHATDPLARCRGVLPRIPARRRHGAGDDGVQRRMGSLPLRHPEGRG